jgi:endonuclease III
VKDRSIGRVLAKIEEQVGPASLEVSEPFAVLVSTLISLRTKDAVTEAAAARLLARAPTPEALARLRAATVERLIFPAGFYRRKARTLIAIAKRLLADHGGEVPSEMGPLLGLRGVGRKTANLVLVRGFGIPALCVDTHVHRISNRLGYVRTRTPAQTERALDAKLPLRHWLAVNELLVHFGQQVCTPLSPRCSLCPVARMCDRRGVTRSR